MAYNLGLSHPDITSSDGSGSQSDSADGTMNWGALVIIVAGGIAGGTFTA
jgi:hypothetical protein